MSVSVLRAMIDAIDRVSIAHSFEQFLECLSPFFELDPIERKMIREYLEYSSLRDDLVTARVEREGGRDPEYPLTKSEQEHFSGLLDQWDTLPAQVKLMFFLFTARLRFRAEDREYNRYSHVRRPLTGHQVYCPE